MEPEDIIEDENEDIFLFLIIPGQLLILKTHIKCIVTNVTLSKIPFARYGFMWSRHQFRSVFGLIYSYHFFYDQLLLNSLI